MKMNAQDLLGKTKDELQTQLMDLRKEQFQTRMQFVTGQLTNPSLLSKTRKDIARIKTAQNGGLTKAGANATVKTEKPKKASNKPVPQMKTTATTKAAPKKAAAKKAVKE